MTRLMHSELTFFFQKAKTQMGFSQKHLVRGGQSDDTAADDDEVVSIHSVSGNAIPNRFASVTSES